MAEKPRGYEDVELLLDNIGVYVKRVAGFGLTDEELRLPAYRYFSGLTAVPNNRILDSLVRRLRVVRRFHIVATERVTRALLDGLFPRGETLTGRDVRLLTFLYRNPNSSPSTAAEALGVSRPTVRRMIRSLKEKVMLRFTNLVDWRRFKLRHIALFFTTRRVTASKRLEQVLLQEMSSYLSTAVFDSTYLRGYASFLIPDQAKPLRLFYRQVAALEDIFLENVQIHDFTAHYVAVCFDYFDYETGDWLIEGDVLAMGLLDFVREHWDILPKPRGMQMTQARPFDKLDYYLASFLQEEGRVKMAKLLERLNLVGIKAARTTVSARKNRLFREGTLVPVIVFDSPLLPVFVTFAYQCKKQLAEQLVVAAAQMPNVFASISEEGCVVNVKVPSRSLGAIIHLLSMVQEEGVEDVLQVQRYKDLGSASPARLAPKWSGSYWRWQEEEFSLPSLGLE